MAGLRSYRQDMPEEHNRIEADRLSDLLFAPCDHARDVLLDEGVPGTVHVTGDVLADVLLATRSRLPEAGEEGEYVLATAHRKLQHRLRRAARQGPRLPAGGAAAGDLPGASADSQEHRRLGPSRFPPTSRSATR